MTHETRDQDLHFLIDPVTRSITNPNTEKVKLIQFDHNSERITFEMPREVDGHDMTLCTKIEVHYINISADRANQNADVYRVDDMKPSEDGEKVTFSWLVSAGATQYAGTLSFLIRFSCLTGEKLDYVWNTALFKGISIDTGMNNGPDVMEDYSDVLAEWEQHVLLSATAAATSAADAERARVAAEAKAGKSAYELACAAGFEGTEEEWLDSLAEEATVKAEGFAGEAAASCAAAEDAHAGAAASNASAEAARDVAEAARAQAEAERLKAEQARAEAEAHTARHVHKWLDDHPEATTTVPDRSLNINKLIVGALGYVTPEMFGAKGDGVTDDTNAFALAIQSGYDIITPKHKTYLVGTDRHSSLFEITSPMKIVANIIDGRKESAANQNKGVFHVKNTDNFTFIGSVKRLDDSKPIDEMIYVAGYAISFEGDCGKCNIDIVCENMRGAVIVGGWSGDGEAEIQKNGIKGLHDSSLFLDVKNVGYSIEGFNVTLSNIEVKAENTHRYIEGCYTDCIINIRAKGTSGGRSPLLFHNAILSDGSCIAPSNNRVHFIDCGTTTRYKSQTILQFAENQWVEEQPPITFANNYVTMSGRMAVTYEQGDYFNPIVFQLSNDNSVVEATIINELQFGGVGAIRLIGNNGVGAFKVNLINKVENLKCTITSKNANDAISIGGRFDGIFIVSLACDLYLDIEKAGTIMKSGSEEITKTVYMNGYIDSVNGTGLNLKYIGSTGNGGGNYLAGPTNKRPHTPQIGTNYYNMTTNILEMWNGSKWLVVRDFNAT